MSLYNLYEIDLGQNTTWHTPQWKNQGQTDNSQIISHMSPSQSSYEVFILSTFDENVFREHPICLKYYITI